MDIREILDFPGVYAAWQAPFVAQKVAPFLEMNDLLTIGRVLEIGCGPGTNAALFEQTPYVGIDINPRYVKAALQRYHRTFLCSDATSFDSINQEPFDAVFINSLLHHLDDVAVESTMCRAATALRSGGQLHVLDQVLPATRGLARFLTRADRGKFARPVAAWETLLSRHFHPQRTQTYAIRFCGITCWQMVYFRGIRRD